MQSTNYNRTMQSGYSELMGLYPPGAGQRLTKAQLHLMSTPRGAPPFNVRDMDRINKELGDMALPNAFVQVPLTQFNNDDIQDDVSYDGCQYIKDVSIARMHNETIWEKYDWMKEQTE